MIVSVSDCIDEYLAFQHVQSQFAWKTGLHQRTYDEFIECPRTYKVNNGRDAVTALKYLIAEWTSGKSTNEIGILLSSGIDSAAVAACLPQGSHAFYATYVEREVDPEIDIVRLYCEINGLNLHVVQVSWDDYEEHMDRLMRIKKAPLHPCEIPVYKCCELAAAIGIKVMFSGWGADTHFGGMDKLMSKDWTLNEFRERYEFCPRRCNLNKDSSVDNCYRPFVKKDGTIDVYGFLTLNYHVMTLRSFFYLPELLGLSHVPAWGYIGLGHELDLGRVRSGDPKYIISEAFRELYDIASFPQIAKIPFTRPTEIYMRDHFAEVPFVPDLKDYAKRCDFTPQQKWMVYALNRFLTANVIAISPKVDRYCASV